MRGTALARPRHAKPAVPAPPAIHSANRPPDVHDEPSFQALNGFPSGVYGRNTRPFNISGAPAISLPCGFTSSGLPIGLQLAGAWWDEATVLRAAHTYQQATDWHERWPEL